MANITLWFKATAGETLAQAKLLGHAIEFNDENAVITGYPWNWDNNVKSYPNPNPEGVRVMSIEDNGFRGFVSPLKGYIRTSQTAKVDILFTMLEMVQITDDLPRGVICLDAPNFPKMTIEADAERGLAIGPGATVAANFTDKAYDFTFPLVFGGTF